MKKIVSIVLALLLLAPILPGFAQDANRVIKVTGTATVSLMADTATIQIGTNTKADTVSKAQSENNTIMQKVIAGAGKRRHCKGGHRHQLLRCIDADGSGFW